MGDQKKNHCCPYEGCSSSFNRPYRLNQHLLTHNNVRAFICPEEDCSKSYTSKSHLDRHINTVHNKNNHIETEVVYSCPTCLKKYVNRQNLKRHIKVSHVLRESFFCDSCKLEFRKKHHLSAHMYVHTGIKAFSCDVCPIEFITLHDKKRHMRCHKTYECPKCLLLFKQWSTYQKHLKADHSTKEYICDTCGRVFKCRNHMVRHLKCHNAKAFLCPYENCNRFYSRNSNLMQHIKMKHERITHNCTICNAKLSTKAKLQEHVLRRHLSEPRMWVPKTLATGRKPRKDIGILKISTALKLAGLSKVPENNSVEAEDAVAPVALNVA